MNVLLIAQCDKRALVESRRILDQFAERRGERVVDVDVGPAGGFVPVRGDLVAEQLVGVLGG